MQNKAGDGSQPPPSLALVQGHGGLAAGGPSRAEGAACGWSPSPGVPRRPCAALGSRADRAALLCSCTAARK